VGIDEHARASPRIARQDGDARLVFGVGQAQYAQRPVPGRESDLRRFGRRSHRYLVTDAPVGAGEEEQRIGLVSGGPDEIDDVADYDDVIPAIGDVVQLAIEGGNRSVQGWDTAEAPVGHPVPCVRGGSPSEPLRQARL
jgi:hypothetical protein